MPTRPYNVLFLCTGNSARSILAEAFLNSAGQERFRAYSAGSKPAGKVNPLALDLLAKSGIPTAGLQPVTAHWGVEDPASVQGSDGDKRQAFLNAFSILARRINLLINLPLARLDRLSLHKQLQEIGKTGQEAKA